MTPLENRIQAISSRIANAARRSGRNPGSVRLVAVSKTIAVERINAAIAAGVTDIGENYVQEAREKYDRLGHRPVNWHFIGHLQSNKAKYAVKMFNLIHSVDSFKLALELNRQAQKIGKKQRILVQINIGEESTKSGIGAQEAIDLVSRVAALEHIVLEGLMTMPPFFNAPEKVRPYFRRLRLLREQIEMASLPKVTLPELSMGMTGDFEVAVEEGATIVRIGTAIYGERQ